ncbi:MAG: biopolymer transporter ExbD [Bauldia sp.]|nr:biopolymer transporter ExbD [Bauldia sp.]
MAGGLAQAPGRGSRRRTKRYQPMAEINVTPFVDVMLVLLIVFMISAPLLTVGVPIDLPETAARSLGGDNEPITVTVGADRKIFLQETEITVEQLVPTLTAIAANGYDERIFVRGDQAVDYGTVSKVLGALNGAGFRRIGLVTAPETGG